MKIKRLEGLGKTFLVLALLFTVVFSAQLTSGALTDSLISYYKMDETSGLVMADSHGTKNATITYIDRGATGKINTAYSFNGNDSSRVTTPTTMGLTQDYTILGWYNPTTINALNYLWGWNGGTNGLYFDSGQVSLFDGSSQLQVYPGVVTSYYNFYAIVATGTNYTLVHYSGNNGTKKVNTAILSDININYLKLGARADDQHDFYGKQDEFAIWNRTLSFAEIDTIYNSNNSLAYPFGSSPVITVNSPSNATTAVAGQTTTFNWTNTVSTGSLVNATFYLNGVANTTQTISGSSNTTTVNLILPPGNNYYYYTTCANSSGTISCTSTNTYLLTVVYIQLNSQTYTSPIGEGITTTFIANISTNATALTTVYLNYSGTSYLATVTTSGTYFIANRTFTTSLVTGSTNYPFNWLITSNEGQTLNTTITNQTVTDILIGNCTTYNVTLYNFTMYDERTQALINGTALNSYVQATFSLYLNDYSSLIQTYSTSFNRTNPFAVCLSSTVGSDTYYIDGEVQYTADTYVKEFYNLLKSGVNSSTLNTNISLYLLNSSFSQLFKVYYKDSSFLPVSNALVQVQRKYLVNGTFITVEQPKTDNDGQTLAHLELNDVIYNFIIVKDGQILSTFENKLAYCPNPTFTDCEIILNEYSSNSEVTDFNTISGLSFDLNYNRTTRVIDLLFSVLSGSSGTVLLNVTLNDNFGNTTICTDSVTSSSGALTCTIPVGFGNASVIADIYYNGNSIGQTVISTYADPSLIYVGSRVLIGVIMVLSLVGISLVGIPIISGFFLIISVILLVSLNIVSSTGIIGASATILWFIIAVILVIFKGGNR